MLIVRGSYHFWPKRVAFRNDYCLRCQAPRRSIAIRTFDVRHLFWIPILPVGFWKRWQCEVCGQAPHIYPKVRRFFKWVGLVFSIAALSLGMAEGAYEAALKYSKQRRQFGKAISDFQAIQWKLADMATEIDAAMLLTMRAASMKDAGMKTTQESSMAKLYASEVAVRCANEGVQIHGGYGFIKDYPAEKFYRDVKLCTIGEGTSEIQKLVIAKQLLSDGA